MTRSVFRGHIPDDLLYDISHDMWVRAEDGQVVIGATSYGIFLAGKIIGFTAKPRGAEVAAGRSLGTIECAKTVLAVHSPVAIVLTQANEELEERAAPVNSDPYGAGWMVRGRPAAWETDRHLLVDAAAYRVHVLQQEPGAEFL